MLRWGEQRSGNWFAYSGELTIGMVVVRDNGTIAWDAANAVHMKWTAEANGEAASVDAAKKQVETAWAKWLTRAALQPK